MFILKYTHSLTPDNSIDGSSLQGTSHKKYIYDIHVENMVTRLVQPEFTVNTPRNWHMGNLNLLVGNCGRAWLAQLVRSLPSDHKLPSSIPGFAEI